MFDDMNLMEAAGGLFMMNDLFGQGSQTTIDDIVDPGGYYRSQGLDAYGRPVATGGPVLGPDGSPIKPKAGPVSQATSKVSNAAKGIGSRINDVRKGYEAGVKPLVNAQTKALQSMIPQGPVRAPGTGGLGMKAGRMAGAALKNPLLQKGLAYAPAIGTALAVGDVVLGDESLGNKAMDATAMTIGGMLGSAVPVVGTGLGIAAGKMVSDGAQFLFGDKKTPEQRKMELALAELRGGVI